MFLECNEFNCLIKKSKTSFCHATVVSKIGSVNTVVIFDFCVVCSNVLYGRPME